MNVDEIRAFGNVYLKPLMLMAVQTMPVKTFVQILLGYGIGVARGAGMTEDDLRKALEQALTATRSD